jgi:hypothetical protein
MSTQTSARVFFLLGASAAFACIVASVVSAQSRYPKSTAKARYKIQAQSLCSSNSAALILKNVHSLVTCGLDAVRRTLFSLNVARHDRAWPAKNKEPQSF